MKHSILILALVIITMPACKKNKKDDNKPVNTTTEKQRLLMNKNWKIYKMVSEGEDITSVIPACAMDNVIFHFSDVKAGYADEGPSKCETTDPQLTNFNWSLIANESRLVIDDHTSKDTIDLLKVSNTELLLGIDDDTMTLRY